MKTSSIFKSFALAFVLGSASLFSGGCSHSSGLEYDFLAPPAYSSSENSQRSLRNAANDWSQAIEDFDRNVTMSRPAGTLTPWHVSSSD